MIRENRSIQWTGWGGKGLENLSLCESTDGLLVDSLVIGEHEGTAYELHYHLQLNPKWHVREMMLSFLQGETVHVFSDGNGNWRDIEGTELLNLSGCVDVDIAATPFTNTLPIRRLGFKNGQSEDIKVAYVHYHL